MSIVMLVKAPRLLSLLCSVLVAFALPMTCVGSDLEVKISKVASEYRFVIDAGSCLRRWTFEDGYPGSRQQAWRLDNGLVWRGDAVSRADGSCTATLGFSVPADSSFVDRTYPFVIEYDSGISIYVPHLVPAEMAGAKIGISLSAANLCAKKTGGCEKKRTLDGGAEGYVVLGTMVGSNPVLAADKETPVWLAERVLRTYRATAKIAQGHLGQIDEQKVEITISRQKTTGEPSWRGWTSGSQIFLVFSGSDWSQTASLEQIVDLFVAHETIHLWNAWKAKQNIGLAPWVNEGSAEYLAILALLEEGQVTEAQAERHVLDYIDSCLLEMQNQTSGHWKIPDDGRGVYSCGVAAQWIVDRSLQKAGAGNVWTFWKSIIDRHGREGYGSEDLLNELSANAKIHSDALWWISGSDKPQADLASAVDSLGLKVGPDSGAATYLATLREKIFTGLLYQYCDGPPYGFYTLSRSVRLDTGSRCGPLSGDPELIAISGAGLFSVELAQAYTKIASVCRKNGSLELGRASGQPFQVTCKVSLASATVPLAVACEAGEGKCLRDDRNGGAGD